MQNRNDRQSAAGRQTGSMRRIFGNGVEVWRYWIVTILIMTIPALFLESLMGLLANTSGAPITTANMGQMINWRMPLIVIVALALIMLFFAFELLGQIHLSRDLLAGGRIRVFPEIWNGIRSLRKFLSPRGLLVILFIVIAVPLCGIGLSLSLTESFYIPNFITQVIFSKPLFAVLYIAGIAALILIAIRLIFTLHAVVLDDMKAGEAMTRSTELIKANWKDFLKRILIVLACSVAVLIAAYLVCKVIPGLAVSNMGKGIPVGQVVDTAGNGLSGLDATEQSIVGYRIAGALSIFLGRYIYAVIYVIVCSNIMIQLTKMYYRYTGRQPEQAQGGEKKRVSFLIFGFIAVPAALVVIACVVGVNFDQISLFQRDRIPQVIAHRTGGYLASENSLEGVDESVKLGVYGAETDIQRTKDGAYIINHDTGFARLTGVDKTPGDLTLAEVRQLRIHDTTGNGALLEVPTLEELLDRCNGRIEAWLELKGVSADSQMADDVVAAVRKKDMTDGAMVISLKYDVLDHIEKNDPDIKTGVLIFAGLGDITKLNCDVIIMEEEMSSLWQISQIHDAGKQAGIWTVNTEDGMTHFMDSGADYIITDEVLMAERIREQFKNRTDFELMEGRLDHLL